MPDNAFGAALLSSTEESMMDVIEAIEKGRVKALMVVESDPFWSFPDQERLKQALNRWTSDSDGLPAFPDGTACTHFFANPDGLRNGDRLCESGGTGSVCDSGALWRHSDFTGRRRQSSDPSFSA